MKLKSFRRFLLITLIVFIFIQHVLFLPSTNVEYYSNIFGIDDLDLNSIEIEKELFSYSTEVQVYSMPIETMASIIDNKNKCNNFENDTVIDWKVGRLDSTQEIQFHPFPYFVDEFLGRDSEFFTQYKDRVVALYNEGKSYYTIMCRIYDAPYFDPDDFIVADYQIIILDEKESKLYSLSHYN